ncbi:MAG TPA: ATP-dependent helicase, partial [Thermoleophilaceae bacterium]|nr:ATP-dependent helicase [Thermoleophilaceae bacterium]
MPVTLDGLDAAQRVAVTHAAGPLLVIGGPGSGKTRVLTCRFAWLVEQGLAPEEILALSFSAATATPMREQLETLLAGPFEELHVGTFESFCTRLLRDEALEAGVDPFFSPVSAADRLALLLERLGQLSLRRHEIRGNPAPLLASFVSRIDRLKQEMISADDYLTHAERLLEQADGDAARAAAGLEREFAGVYSDHDRLLAERGALDNGDLVLRCFRLLLEKPHVRSRAAARFKQVLVDDYQDTNFAQGMLLRLLIEEHREVTVAGNDDEAVHRLQGAGKNLLEFERELPGAEAVRLERSHRSGRRIAKAALAVVEPVAQRIPKRLKASGRDEVRFWRCHTERAQAQAVAAAAERLVSQQGV